MVNLINRSLRFIRIIKGGVENNLEFTMGPDTSVYASCSATLNGQLFVFGGSRFSGKQKQVNFIYQNPIKSNSSI